MSEVVLQVKNVSRHYTQGEVQIAAVDKVSFSVEKASSTAIVGPSGSGKTTLLSLLAGLDKSDAGDIQLSGTSLASLNEKELTKFRAKQIGIVFQQFYLMQNLSALENVSLPLEIQQDPKAESKATEILKSVGLGDRLHHLPHQLSGGECQRVAIARALVVDPVILLADEPSGNLDSQTGAKVMDLLFAEVAKRQMTMILVTHDQTLAQRCDRQLAMMSGSLKC